MNIEVIGMWPFGTKCMRAELLLKSVEQIGTDDGPHAKFEMHAYVVLQLQDDEESFDELAAEARQTLLSWVRDRLPQA